MAGTVPERQAQRLRASAALAYPFTPPLPGDSVVAVAPGILWARIAMPMALDHINVYLLRDGAGWTAVDTGLNTPASRAAWEHLAATHLQGLPIQRLICTHSHYDHAGQAAWMVERFGAQLCMSYGEYFMLRGFYGPPPDPLPPLQQRFYRRAGMTDTQIEHMFSSLRRDPFMPPVPESYQRLRDGDVLQIGPRAWRVVVGEGHSPEHVCLYHSQGDEHILIAGDQLLPRITSNVLLTHVEPEGDPLRLWLASLDRLGGLHPDSLVLPSHQSVFRGLHARVAELHTHHQQQFALLRTALQKHPGATAWHLMQAQFPQRRHAMDDLLAMGETLAHLSCLRCQGQIRRALDDDGLYRFHLADASAAPAEALSETHHE